MGNNSSKKSNSESVIQSPQKPKHTTTPTKTTIDNNFDDVDDHPTQITSPIQMPQTPLTESIAYHLTRLRSANKLTDHSGMQTPSILLRRRIAKDLGLDKAIARDLNSAMDPRSPNVIRPRTPMLLNDRGKVKSSSTAKNVRNVNRRLNVDDENGRENRVTLRKVRSEAEIKATKQSSENEVTSTVDDFLPIKSTENLDTKDMPDSTGRRLKVRNVYTTPKYANIRPRIDTGRTPLSVISQSSDMDEKTPIRTKFATPRARSVSRIPVYKR